ncbi:MAG: TldD/PmbA family protein [Candidatus Tectomicrobia bacterium]|nr:TldD/PmbA family protein [Candidatus Tectomicrobia bacterium]
MAAGGFTRLGRDRLLSPLETLLKDPPADRVEAFLVRRTGGYARCARSRIHQSAEESRLVVSIRAAEGRRVGVASTNRLTPEAVQNALESALQAARASPEAGHLGPLAEPWEAPEGYLDEETASFPPAARAEALSRAFEAAGRRGQTLAGVFSTWLEERAAANSAGLRAYATRTSAEASLIAEGRREGHYTPSGYAHGICRRVGDLDIAVLSERAVKKCALSVSPRILPPGRYVALWEPPCVAEVLEWLCFTGLGAQAHLDGRGFMSGRIGQKVTGEGFSLWDDAADPEGLSFPFDAEGNPKRRIDLIERGVARGVALDSAQGARAGAPSTGHAGSLNLAAEPLPRHLFVASGDAPMEDLSSRMERGIWITRFHYVNGYLHPPTALMTGMTRDGTFWVEDGRIQHPLCNLRFTQGMLEAFSRIRAASRERQRVGATWDAGVTCVVPALLIDDFRITGAMPKADA